MPRADLLLQLVESGSKGDKNLFRKTVEAIIAEEKSKKHIVFANKLQESFKLTNYETKPTATHFYNNTSKSESSIENLLYESIPVIKIHDLVLSPQIRKFVSEFIEEQHRSDLLRSYAIEPRNRIMFVGSPGNGKTSLAEAIAYESSLPLYTIRYEGLIGSYLGETSLRLKTLFDFIRNQRCVVFFDEFDAIGKERGDEHETGEIKRVVSTLLLQIDQLPSYAIIIAATNHPELLDKAVWRRFQIKMSIEGPSENDIIEFLGRFQRKHGIQFGIALRTLALQLKGNNYSEIQDFCMDVLRRFILSAADSKNLKTITKTLLDIKKNSYHPKLKTNVR